MNFLSIFILLVSILSTTLGYKFDCNSGGCSVCMTPKESEYSVFLETIPEKTLALGFNFDIDDTDNLYYNTVNKRIKEDVDQKIKKQFVEKLGQSPNKSPINVKVVPDLSKC